MVGDLSAEFDKAERQRHLARWWMTATVAAAVVLFWLTGPYGVVLLLRGSPWGVVLIVVALLSVVGGFLAFRRSRRLVPASDYVIEADASEQADPAAAGPIASKGLGWVMTFLNRWSDGAG